MMSTGPHGGAGGALIYARVSTTEQAAEGVSLAAQEAKCRAYCVANDLACVGVEVDAGQSGKSTDRPGLQLVLAAVRAGAVGAVVVPKLDRLSRRVVDTLALVEEIEAAGAAFHSVGEKIDTSSAVGRFFLTIVAAFAEMERGVISERTKTALAHLKSEGKHVGSPPLGWAIGDSGALVPDSYGQGLIAHARGLRASGATLSAIAATMDAEGWQTQRGGRWTPEAAKAVISRGRLVDD